MISEKLLTYLHNDIQLYDEKEGKDYLIAFGKGKNDELKCCQVMFYHYNFWHLIGCEVVSEDHLATYVAVKIEKIFRKKYHLYIVMQRQK